MKLIDRHIVFLLSQATKRYTLPQLQSRAQAELGVSRWHISRAVRRLVDSGFLSYTYCYGCSFVEIAFNRPVRVSQRVGLTPAGKHISDKNGVFWVVLHHGAAFGIGNHPTTRLSIQAIDWVLDQDQDWFSKTGSVLDVGTGSGVLAITAVGLGMTNALALDIESIARSEARKNVDLNRMAGRISISGDDFSTVSEKYDLVMANLRLPTLLELVLHIPDMVNKKTGIVLSGVRSTELPILDRGCKQVGMNVVRKRTENKWGVLVAHL